MKNKHLVATALLATALASHAQNVTLYGSLDGGVEFLNNVGGNHLTRVPGITASQPSRWGLQGSEDLGQGMKALFRLEQGFGIDSGNLGQGGRAFGRESWVGLSGPWGQLSFGRQYTMYAWSLRSANITGPNLYGSASLDPYTAGARADNAIAYKGTFQGLTVGATYSLGRDTVAGCAGENGADSKACREWSALLKYDTKSWGVAAAHDRLTGGTGAPAGLNSSALSDSRSVLNGYAVFGNLKIGAGVIRRNNEGSAVPKSDLWHAGAAYRLSPSWTLDGELFRLDFKNSANAATLATARATYHLSKRTAVYGTVGHINNRNTLALSVSSGQGGSAPPAGESQTGVTLGLRHAF